MNKSEIEKNEIENKINEIQTLINNEDALAKYINEIENTECAVPKDLNSKIISKINEKYKETDKVLSFKLNYPNILKIAACTIFSLVIWQVTIANNVSYANSFERTNKKVNTAYENIDNSIKKLNHFFMQPVKLERGKK
ncbi:MAG: hypothetical protein RSB51_06200 [Clostridia bacterium]